MNRVGMFGVSQTPNQFSDSRCCYLYYANIMWVGTTIANPMLSVYWRKVFLEQKRKPDQGLYVYILCQMGEKKTYNLLGIYERYPST